MNVLVSFFVPLPEVAYISLTGLLLISVPTNCQRLPLPEGAQQQLLWSFFMEDMSGIIKLALC